MESAEGAIDRIIRLDDATDNISIKRGVKLGCPLSQLF
jgi:hypothetical protein